MAGLRALRMRWKRRRFLWKAWRARHDLTVFRDRTSAIRTDDILLFICLRNEAERLPHFLEHYRTLGVSHFLVVDNGSSDGSAELLESERDVSLWSTKASYRSSRFGMDWINHLLARYGSGQWCLTVDADELLVYPDHESGDLRTLTSELDAAGQSKFGALLLDLYPEGALGAQRPAGDPLKILNGFDPCGYRVRIQPLMNSLWIQGGARARVFFGDEPERAPTLNKTPLVKWHWRYAYASSTHSLLPRRLNNWRGQRNGVLLHTKFLPSIVRKAREEKARGEHFGTPAQYDGYYDALLEGPSLWHDGTARYDGWGSLEASGMFGVTLDEGEIYRDDAPTYSVSQQKAATCLPDAAGLGRDTGRTQAVSPKEAIGRD